MSIKVEFITLDNQSVVVAGEVGQNLRDLAVENLVDGIIGECGGNCSCGTCHIHIDPAWINKIDGMEDNSLEDAVLSMLDEKLENSRLGCQVELTEDMNGLRVHVAPEEV